MESTAIKPRRAWLAALLSMLGGALGQIYCGRLRRALMLWLMGGLLAAIVLMACISLPIGPIGLGVLLLCVVAYKIFLPVDAFRIARQSGAVPRKRYQRWWFYILAYLAFVACSNLAAYGMRAYLAEAFMVPGRAMSPTIQHRDRILVDRFSLDAENIRRGSVVVFRSEGAGSPLFAMRVVGLPGDVVELRNDRLWVNGVEADDPHAVFDGPFLPHVDVVDYGPLTVPDNTFFVLGDNRRRSFDSRFLGPIPSADFYGIARLIYWSRDHAFPNPEDISTAIPGPIRWDRIGRRLD